MLKFVYPLFITLCFLFIISCKSTNNRNNTNYTYNERQEMAAAQTAAEWLSRLQLDLKDPQLMGLPISRLYAELPSIDQWPSITDELDKITKDDTSYLEFTKTNHGYFDKELNEINRLKIQLFSILLAEDGTDAEPVYRSLILKENNRNAISSYKHAATLKKLLSLSKDHDSSIAWFNKNIEVEQSNYSHSSTSQKESEWMKALAKNDINVGIKLLLKAIKNSNEDEKAELISSLASLAHLLDKPELGEKAMTMLEENIISQKETQGYLRAYSYRNGLNYYAHQREWDRLYKLCVKFENTKRRKIGSSYDRSSSGDMLFQYRLTALYKLKNFDEFEKEITAAIQKHRDPTQAQGGAKDFIDLIEKKVANNRSIASLHIDILTAKGDEASKGQAYKICTHLLARNQGVDAYYKRLIALKPLEASSFIASLRKYDPFEERPLIWQSEMALQAGDIDKAETLIQQAIALDPSDGDHGKFTRMHCYDVLARILEKQGKPEKAKFFNEVVVSIRAGEAADDYLYAGLTQEATDRYKKALGHFNDAYCLQSRLAKTLMEAGKFDEAIPYFKKAFELMPVSFGPRESHCFGCEGIFDDKRVQNLALPTLQAFLDKEPANPRTPYLLGLLFEEMKKEPEAISAYEKALELDPEYYNAARTLYNIISKDPKKFAQTLVLQKQLLEIAAYQTKPTYITSSHLLKSYWKLAHDFPPSPIKLAPLEELGFPVRKLSDQQFKEHSENSIRSYSYHNAESGLDGWSASEILLRNNFLNDDL